MLTLPPAHTLGAALAQATAGALGSLLTIVAICAPVLLLWLGCRWLEQRLSPSMPPDAADGVAADGDGAQLTVTTTPTIRALRSTGRQTLGRQTLGQTLMSPLTLSDLDLAQVATFPALPAAPAPPAPDDAPSATHCSAFPLYQPPVAAMPAAPAMPSSQSQQPYQPWDQGLDNWPPRGKPGQYPYRYIFVGSVLVRVASLYPYIAGDVQHDIWN